MKLLSAALAIALPICAAEPRTIPNPLGQDWPWELVSMDFPAGSASPDWVATIDGVAEPRPVQIEKAEADGNPLGPTAKSSNGCALSPHPAPPWSR